MGGSLLIEKKGEGRERARGTETSHGEPISFFGVTGGSQPVKPVSPRFIHSARLEASKRKQTPHHSPLEWGHDSSLACGRANALTPLNQKKIDKSGRDHRGRSSMPGGS